MSQPASFVFHAASPEGTTLLAEKLAGFLCHPGDCVLLRGELGVGKTAFARAFIQASCEAPGEVTSPTFTLLNPYTRKDGSALLHADLYRLETLEEALNIGIEEMLPQSVSLIEWPEIIRPLWSARAVLVEGEFDLASEARRWRLQPVAEAPAGWAEFLEGLR